MFYSSCFSLPPQQVALHACKLLMVFLTFIALNGHISDWLFIAYLFYIHANHLYIHICTNYTTFKVLHQSILFYKKAVQPKPDLRKMVRYSS